MNIILFLNRDLEANLSYNLLKPTLSKHNYKIYYTDAVGNPDKKPSDLLDLERLEKSFFYNELLSFIQENTIETDFEFFDANFSTVPIQKAGNVNSAEFIDEVKSFEPDLFISIRFGKIFKDDIISIPKKGLINLHSAILPDYRGILGTLHCLKDDATETGITLHTIPNSGIDTGEIIDIAKISVDKQRSLLWHVVQLYPKGCELISKAIQDIENNTLQTSEQNHNEGNYFSVPTKEDFEVLKSVGFSVTSKKDYIEVIIEIILKNATAADKKIVSAFLNTSC